MNSINLVVASLPRHFNCRYHSESRAYDICLILSVEKFVSIWWNISIRQVMKINSKNFCPSIFQKPSHPLPAAGGRSHRPLPGHSTAIIKSQNIRFADCLDLNFSQNWEDANFSGQNSEDFSASAATTTRRRAGRRNDKLLSFFGSPFFYPGSNSLEVVGNFFWDFNLFF